MEIAVIMNVLEILLYIVLGGLALWFKTNSKLNNAVNGLIAKAEEEFTGFKHGNEKFQAVVNWLYELIPTFLKPFFPKKFVEALIQNAFEQSAAYAEQQLDKIVDKVVKPDEKIEEKPIE